MGDLIWIGNTLLPCGVVLVAVGLVAVMLIGMFTWLTDERRF